MRCLDGYRVAGATELCPEGSLRDLVGDFAGQLMRSPEMNSQRVSS